MTIFDIIQPIIELLTNQNFIIKITLVLLLTVYTIFSAIVARQISIMNTLINQLDFSAFFKLLAWLHFILSCVLLLFILRVL